MNTLVWAHRGASGYAPENTIEAFELAAKQHADGVELDVQLTKDDQLVVVHDETIERVTGNPGWVKDYTLSELKAMKFNKTHPEYENATIPTLEEVYECLKPTGLTVNVELKTGVIWYTGIETKVLDLAAGMGMEDRVIYSSFNHETLVRMKKLKDDIKTGLLYSDVWIGVPRYAKEVVGVDALHPALYHLQDPYYVRQAHEYGLKTHVWTVNEPEHLRLCKEMGVEAVITNVPDIAIEIVK